MPLATNPLIDEILAEHDDLSGGDRLGWSQYRNHAQRVFLFASRLVEPRPNAHEMLAVAAAFHDISVLRTLDYLVPNLELADAWLRARGRAAWRREIGLAMTLHHRVRPYRGEGAWLVEPIRRADWLEVTGGLVGPGIDRRLARQARRELPISAFAARSARRIVAHAVTHPLDPFPFWRSRPALRRVP